MQIVHPFVNPIWQYLGICSCLGRRPLVFWILLCTPFCSLLPSFELDVFLFQWYVVTNHNGISNICSIRHLMSRNKKIVLVPVIYSLPGRPVPTPCASHPNSLEYDFVHVLLSGSTTKWSIVCHEPVFHEIYDLLYVALMHYYYLEWYFVRENFGILTKWVLVSGRNSTCTLLYFCIWILKFCIVVF